MLHRFQEDSRALLWAFGFLPCVPALALIEPALSPWLLPVSLYLAFCSGVLAHNHNHCPVFHDRRLNLAYGAWLSIFYGFPTFAWVPTHNQNHHRYLNGEMDATRTTRHASTNSLLAAFTYPFRSSSWQLRVIFEYSRSAKAWHGKRLRRMAFESALLVGAQVGFLCLAIALHGAREGALVYALSAGIPALFAPWSVMFVNYVQHVDCDPESRNDHSRNFISGWSNYLTFDNGYHTVHHEQPGVHWSRYKALHAARANCIDPRLNQSSIFGYCLQTYVVSPLSVCFRARVPTSSKHAGGSEAEC